MGAAHEYSSVQPKEGAHQQTSSSAHKCRDCLALCKLLTLVSVVTYGMSYLADQVFAQVPHYSVAIDNVSGLDPTTDLGPGTTLEPEFNLTLRVASWGLWATQCAEPRMYATVSYRGVSLAASATLTRQICAGPMKAVEHHIVAGGAGVVVPGSLLYSLAMDMRSGMPEFDVELHGPGPREDEKVVMRAKAGRRQRLFGEGVQASAAQVQWVPLAAHDGILANGDICRLLNTAQLSY